ncbi:FadR family transcriptional regulator [Sphingomonas sp. S1-29]|uniref:FadR family transcriptional regulator n=1 Tax=Sphingomonas qomolangmaensis TaxID=2918765 RepID=A0ABY5LBB2_9SPHN|nr:MULTISPECIES: FadR/GntR family transcriptional regulator [Sphingomonas]UUL83100.1 FadR family transcriptional regulator [Sphingomonas qomolangmaensis]UZK69623.1 FadR family transcriptional regulator [Sphingomonas sp. S1-29]
MIEEDSVFVRPELGRNLTHGMLEVLGRAIVTGVYADRPFPTEAEIAKVHGVSRSVTREAVKMLTAKGLVSARPRQGTIVQPAQAWNLFDPDVLRWLLERKFSVELLRQFNQLRIGIEPAAASLAARFHDAADLRAIRGGLDAMTAAERGDGDALDADIAFHLAILRASKNPFYEQFQMLVSTALRTSIRFTNKIKGRSANIVDHAAVADAIERRDVEGAHRAMTVIIGDVLDLIAERD